MTDKQTIVFLKKQIALLSEREKEHLKLIRQQTKQIGQQTTLIHHMSGQIDGFSVQLMEQTLTIASLKEALLEKNKNISSLSGKNRGLSKLLAGNESEKQTPAEQTDEEPEVKTPKKAPTPKERGNNQAKRKEHFCLEEVLEEIWPDHPAFDRSKAHIISHVDSIRYSYIPPRFIKYIKRQYNCAGDDGQVFPVSVPRTPLMNSSYDASFIAGIVQLRYIYSMPVERIIKLFNENKFDLNKPTAHGLLHKTYNLLSGFDEVLRKAIQEDTYIRMDETYHKVLTDEKNTKGKGVRKGYLWSAMAEHLQLIHFFYNDGSREKVILTGYLDNDYRGAVHADGYTGYHEIDTDDYPYAIRLFCVQHAKRKFLEIENDEQAKDVVETINQLYKIEHEIPPDISPEKKLETRLEKAPPILTKLKAKLQLIKDDPLTLPSTPLAVATNFLLNEFGAVENYLLHPDYTLDNNPQERQNRYISLSRRNSLFFGSHEGAKRSALFYSLACSCRLHDINVFEYFNDLLTRMPYLPSNASYEVLRELLPDKWQKLTEEQTRSLHTPDK